MDNIDLTKLAEMETTGIMKTTLQYATVIQPCKEKRVVGYYDRNGKGIRRGQIAKLTHIIYCCFESATTCAADFALTEPNFLEWVRGVRDANKELKVLASIRNVYHCLSDETKQMEMIHSITSMIKHYDLDGIELYSIPSKTHRARNYVVFIQNLKNQLIITKNATPREFDYIFCISTAWIVPFLPFTSHWEDFINQIDFINVLSYYEDETSIWIPTLSPIFNGIHRNLDNTMRNLVCRIRSPAKINMGVAFYGEYWTHIDLPLYRDRFYWDFNGANFSFWFNKHRFINLNALEEALEEWANPEPHFDKYSKSSYYWEPQTKHLLMIETVKSLREKVIYANQKNFGGIAIWLVHPTDEDDTLLDVILEENECSTGEKNEIKYYCDL